MNVLIFLGGEKPTPQLAQDAADQADLVIAADSGYSVISETQIKPAVVTGDFDSIGTVPQPKGFQVIPAPEQDATDFQKALRHVPAESTQVEILGGTGLRSDHFLTNLLIASSLPLNMSVAFHDATQSIHRVAPDHPFSIAVEPQTVISLIPFASCEGVSTDGLHWNLDKASMSPSGLLGQSNRADSEEVQITIAAGILYVVINHPEGTSYPYGGK